MIVLRGLKTRSALKLDKPPPPPYDPSSGGNARGIKDETTIVKSKIFQAFLLYIDQIYQN